MEYFSAMKKIEHFYMPSYEQASNTLWSMKEARRIRLHVYDYLYEMFKKSVETK